MAKNSTPVTVGIHAAEGSQSHGKGVTVLDVAQWMEFGTDTVPERSYIRAYFDENGERIQKMLEVMAVSVASGKRTREQAIELIGVKLVGEVQARIRRGLPPPLKYRDGIPLDDTGQLISSITYEVAK